jgi:hypothetical protein
VNVYQKLNAAREKFHTAEIKKSGYNNYAGYYYFELGDFILPALKIFKEVGLTSVIRFEPDIATMEIVNNEKPEDRIYITSPMSEAALKGCHPVQNLGAVETYVRRYLWTAALEIVEHDALDATTGNSEPAKTESKAATKSKAEPKDEGKTVEGAKIVSVDPTPDQILFVDSLVEIGTTCVTLSELTSLWKANQGQIDDLKKNCKSEFKRLQEKFAELKSKFSEE